MKTLPDSLAAIVISLILTSSAAAAIYKVVDDKGNITYTDAPAAEVAGDEVLLPAINPISSSAPAPTAERPLVPVDTEQVVAFPGYSFAALVSPSDDSLVHFDQPNVLAQLALIPELDADHLVQFYVDGSAAGNPVAKTSLSISGLERGSHRISARVLSSQGAVLVITPSVTVHVQRHYKRN